MGTTYLDRAAIGTISVNPGGGAVDLGKIREASLEIDGKRVDHIDVESYPFGVDLSIFTNVLIEIGFTWENIADINLWLMMLHGTVAGLTTTTAGTAAVTDEVVVMSGAYNGTPNVWHQLAYAADFEVDCAVTVCSAVLGGGTTYVENTSYKLDRKTGCIGRISGGAITDGQAVYVTYTKNTYAGKYFAPFSDTIPAQYTVILDKPLLYGKHLRVTHDLVQFDSKFTMSLKPGDTGEWVGVPDKITFLKNSSGAYGTYGRWEIYMP